MGWRAVLSRASHASQRFRDAKLDFNRAAFGLEKEPPLWKTCVKLLSAFMKEVVGRLYVIKRFSARSKQNVSRLSRSQKCSFFVRKLHLFKNAGIFVRLSSNRVRFLTDCTIPAEMPVGGSVLCELM